jgi:hypothetical protein
MKRTAALLVLICGLFPWPALAQSQDDEPAEANPGRPTVSTPAMLTPVGYLQFESGLTAVGHSPELSSSYGFNEVIKLSVTRRIELLASSQPIARSTVGGVRSNGAGDVSLGAQGVLYSGDGARPTLAVSCFRRVYGGDAPDLDVGSARDSFLALASADVKGFHYDANLFFNDMVEEPVRRAQFGQSLTISHALPGDFNLSGEVWHFTQPFLQGNAVGTLWAVSYAARKNLVFDTGFDRGLTGTSTQWEVFAGFTYLLPHRLWRRNEKRTSAGAVRSILDHERRAG